MIYLNGVIIVVKMQDKDIIISQPWGGLGDNLQFSTLPELYSKMGYNVYISSSNAFRNSEIYDLVWKLNPFVKGISDKPANVGCEGIDVFGGSHMRNIELCNGLTNGYRKYPVVYYTPKLIPELKGCVLYDATATSFPASDLELKASFESVFRKYPDAKTLKVNFTNIKTRDTPYFKHDLYTVNSIFDLCDAIHSCQVFVADDSGSLVLASALKQDSSAPEVFSFYRPGRQPQSAFKFDNVSQSLFIRD